jgi:hypothetical protein
MAGTLYNYVYNSTDGKVSYSGQVVADSSQAQYNYVPGQAYKAVDGTYTIATGNGTPTNAPVGSVYQQTYTSNGTTYDTYHYDVGSNTYYDVKTQPYDPTTGKYTPPATPTNPNPTPVSMWSTTAGLGSEYAYVKGPDNSYHVYGGGGDAYAQITPTALGTHVYDYKFTYPNGDYYLGKVVDDGTWGYKVGDAEQHGSGSYSIYAQETSPSPAGALAGYTYTLLYHDAANNTNYAPSDIIPGTPYYQKASGYGGLGSEHDWIQKNGAYYKFSSGGSVGDTPPVQAVPLPGTT